MEILTGKKAIDKNRPTGEHNLVEWAKPYLTNKRRIFRVLDSRLEGQYSLGRAMKLANLALQCLSIEPKLRPTMDEVVTALEQLHNSKDAEPKNEKKESHSNRQGNPNIGPRYCRSSSEETPRRVTSYPRPSTSQLYA